MSRSNENLPIDQSDPLGEFPHGLWPEGADSAVSRRAFMQLMGASLALAGLTTLPGCSDKPPDERIVPYVNQPEFLVAGNPKIFASAMPMDGYGKGILVTSREGRPIKIEGNPDHPASLGTTDAFVQASILSLYDPDRARTVTLGGNVSSWGAFEQVLQPRLRAKQATGGAGLRILTPPFTSPTLAQQQRQFLERFPQARWHIHSPLMGSNTAAGLAAAFGERLDVGYDLTNAKVIVALGSDFLIDQPGSLRYARQFAGARRARADRQEMSRLYVAESGLSITGSMADHRLAIRASEIETLARALAAAVGAPGAAGSLPANPRQSQWVRAVADDLRQYRGQCLVIAGESQSPAVHTLAHAINFALGNVGKTLSYISALAPAAPGSSLADLAADIRGKAVDTLLILGGNPVYTAPADLDFSSALAELSNQRTGDGELANLTARLGLYEDETSFFCQWHLPEAHYLESWSDVRAFDGTASLIQPLIAPLYQGISIHEVCNALLEQPRQGGYETVRGYWQSQHSGADFETWWRQSLKSGVIAGTVSPARNVPAPKLAAGAAAQAAAPDSLEILFAPDYSAWDGSFANNPWLQELPRPLTKLTWDNAAVCSPATALKLGLEQEDVVSLVFRGRSVEASVLLLPGLPDGSVTVHLGYGRTRGGSVAANVGFNAFHLRTSDALWSGQGLQIIKVGGKRHLVTTRSHHAMSAPDAIATLAQPPDDREVHNRRLVRIGTLAQFRENPRFVQDLGGEKEKKPLLTLYPGPEKGGWDYSKGYQWGMSIDMTACIGCNACMVACQAENNIPVVGRDQVDRQREMHWLRIDDYFSGPPEDPRITHQPVPCMHCENAPCEYVCPTGATTHSAEGLNQMTYNRCVGTRYCSNNCPYKVRRFNFLGYADAETTEQRKLQRNPDVTVRTNGVMEKCTYCIQRIQRTRIAAEKMKVDLAEQARTAADEPTRQKLKDQAQRREFEILQQLQTACQQVCPTQAIIFGSIAPVGGQKTEVARLKEEPLDYSLLHELTTKPRTTYLARLTNPNPAIRPEGGTL